MEYPKTIAVKVPKVFGDEEIEITLNSGLTTLVGTNAAGKTQTLRALQSALRTELGPNAVRFLSSNRIGSMESFRSKVDNSLRPAENFSFGSENQKKIRRQIETATGDFFTMDERRDVYVKVSERLSTLFHRAIHIRWYEGNLKVFFGRTDHEAEYSVVAEASGLINIISLLAALYDDDVQVLLIDEPEVSLHPQMQAYLLREMRYAINRYGKTIVIATHSVEMIEVSKADELCNFVFFNEGKTPIQIPRNEPVLDGRQMQDFILRMGLVYHEGFFAKKILLVEGVSDLILCRFLCGKLDLNIDAAGAQLIPVDGKGQFPVVTKLFRLMGKSVCMITDLDSFTDDNSVVNSFAMLPEAAAIAHRYGNADLQGMIRDIKTKLEQLIRDNKPALQVIYDTHPYWKHFRAEDGDAEEAKAVRRAVTAQLFSTEDLASWPAAVEWAALRTRLNVLLNILAELGCFILRRGAIESYYCVASRDTYDGKPTAAVEEIAGVQALDAVTISGQYDDIVCALKFAAQDKTVDESEPVKAELASEVAPAMLKLTNLAEMPIDEANKVIHSAIRQTKNGAASIFTYQVVNGDHGRELQVDLPSQILDVAGFPLTLRDTDDAVKKIRETIRSER